MTDDQTSNAQGSAIDPRTAPTGNWSLIACIVLALLWWGASAALVFAYSQGNALANLSEPVLIGGALLLLIPGFILIMLGIVMRQSMRSRGANDLIIHAATNLLAPASTATAEIKTLADATRESTRSIDKTTSDALASMKTMHEALSAERLRAESVSYAMADNARELTERLADERKGLETLTKAMDAQASMMGDVIPKQSAAMVAAAKAAGEEVAAADNALEERLKQLKQAGSTLAVRLTDLDAIAKDAAERTDGLVQSITAIEDKLSRSDKTIERAEQSSAMAVEAANSVGAALQQAVSAALDGAREANEEIDRISRKLHEDAAHSITELRLAGIDAAKGEAPLALETANIVSQTSILSSPHVNGDHDAGPPNGFTVKTEPHHDAPLRGEPSSLPPTTAPTADDTDLFDGSDAQGPAETPPHIHVHPSHQPPEGDAGWSDIISDLDNEDSAREIDPVAGMDRQDIAMTFMDQLQGSGIALPNIFRPRDKKKIAAASRKSAKARRVATRNTGGDDVDRVFNRLRKDNELNALAHAFIDLEHAEALQALADTSGTARPASPRLAAFLLADAALSHD
ncbi:MAG: hypothetical protein ABJG15_04100 [Hyphomonadaceae bacterium]